MLSSDIAWRHWRCKLNVALRVGFSITCAVPKKGPFVGLLHGLVISILFVISIVKCYFIWWSAAALSRYVGMVLHFGCWAVAGRDDEFELCV